jgi:phosphoenolpyruvate synthase/pyruvate phosphate dikinase
MSASLRNLKNKEKEGVLDQVSIKEHLSRFGWIKAAYNIVESYTEDDLKNELRNVGSESHEVLDIPDDFMLNGLRAGVFIRNRIKELSQQIWFAAEPLTISLAKYLEISREDFYTLLYDEVVDVLHSRNQIDIKKIKERQKGYVYGFIDSKEILLVGEDFKVVESALIKKPDADVKEIKGQIACKGKVVGIVKVVRGHEDFGKLSDGEILVVSMTTPDYMIIIKKAAAIVTDEGGLSCHAAIVSREFNIPCIMGTKIATQVLKDGMKIEVDANVGLVKILE